MPGQHSKEDNNMNAIDWELAEGLDNKFMHELAEAAMLAEEDTSSKRYHIKDDVALESSLLPFAGGDEGGE